MDLFLLSGLAIGKEVPTECVRVESFPDGMPDSIRMSLSKLLAKDPNFPSGVKKSEIEKNTTRVTPLTT